jgi:hypothetical protein
MFTGRVLVPLVFADDLPGVLHGWSAAEPGWHRPGCPVSPFQRCGGDGDGVRSEAAWTRLGAVDARGRPPGRGGAGPSTNTSST